MERPTAYGYAGIMLGFVGLGLLLAPRLANVRGTATELAGIAIQIVATWLWTTGSIISKRRPVEADAIVSTGIQMLAAGVVLTVIATLHGEWSRVTFTPAGIGAILYLVVFGSCVAFTAFIWLLRNAPASKVMTYAYVNPVVAMFLGWLILNEVVDGWVLAGMIIIVAGVALATSAPTRPSVAPKASTFSP